jgi:hypothetical protein
LYGAVLKKNKYKENLLCVRCFFYAIRVQKAGTIMDDAQKEELTKVVDLPFWGRAHYFVKFALPAQIEAYFRWTFAENDQIRVVGWSFYDSTGSGTDYGLHIPQLGHLSLSEMDNMVASAIRRAAENEHKFLYEFEHGSGALAVAQMRQILRCSPGLVRWKWRAVHNCWSPPNGLGYKKLNQERV